MVAYSMSRHDDGEINQDGLTPEEREYKRLVIPALLNRAYHLPHNNWCQDWMQYMTNNHPLFSICCHHRYHPISRATRIFALIGSVLFGLAITNIIYLAFVFTDSDYDKAYVEIPANITNPQLDETADMISPTNGNIALWTVGGILHGTFDNLIWSLAACSCLKDSPFLDRYRGRATLLIFGLVIVVTAVATFAAALRAALDEDNVEQVSNYGLLNDNQVNLWQVESVSDYEFVLAYLVELGLNYFVYYPVLGTLFFSGILSCRGRCTFFGGRPYEVQVEREGPKEPEEEDAEQPRRRRGGKKKKKEKETADDEEP